MVVVLDFHLSITTEVLCRNPKNNRKDKRGLRIMKIIRHNNCLPSVLYMTSCRDVVKIDKKKMILFYCNVLWLSAYFCKSRSKCTLVSEI